MIPSQIRELRFPVSRQQQHPSTVHSVPGHCRRQGAQWSMTPCCHGQWSHRTAPPCGWDLPPPPARPHGRAARPSGKINPGPVIPQLEAHTASPHTEAAATPTLGLELDQLARWKLGATGRLHSFPEASLWGQGEAGECPVVPAHTLQNTGLHIGGHTQRPRYKHITRKTAIRIHTHEHRHA